MKFAQENAKHAQKLEAFCKDLSEQILARHLVVAGFAAAATVVKTVFTKTYVELSLAENAVLLALAAFFDLFTLAAADLGFGCRHGMTLAPAWFGGNVPLVTSTVSYGLQAIS